ncbi:MAG: YitT family protein [Salinivirgaceae bacterium]
MAFVTKEKLFTREWFLAYSYLLAGSFILALGIVLFVNPYKLAPGGTYGIAIVLHHLLGWTISGTALSFDVPLLILGTIVLGPRFGVKTVVSTFAIAGFIYLLETYLWGYEPLLPDDALLSTIFGGVMYGIALGLIFKSRATSGGSDIIAMIMSKYFKHITLGQLVVIVDSIIVLLTLFAFNDWKLPFYSWILIYIEGKVIDIVIGGANYHKTVMVISEKYNEISEKIRNDIGRGATIFKGEGAYEGKERHMVYSVMSRRELEILKSFVKEIDDKAFINITEANEILGKGFSALKKQDETLTV